jgi:competence protein ComEC
MNSAWASNTHQVGGLFWALLAWVIGVALQLQEQQLLPPLAYGIGLAASVVLQIVFSLSKSAYFVRMASLVLSVTLLAFCVTGLRAVHYQDQSLPGELEGKDIAVTGLVAAMPLRNETGQKFRFLIESASMANSQVRLPNYLYLSWYRGNWSRHSAENDLQRAPVELRAGERWQFTVRLKAPHGGLNPQGFDFELWLWEQGLQATGYVRNGLKDPRPKLINRTAWYPVEQSRQRVRDAIFDQLARQGDLDSIHLDARLAAILAALVVGDQQGIDRADWDIFRATGVAHLMSISGLHVTMFAWLAMGVVGWAWRRSGRLCLRVPASSAAMVAGVILALAYAIFSGWGLPAQRTVWMLATVAWLRLSAKDWPWPMVWLLTCAVVVAIDPWALMQAGFWLSFIAVGVLFASGTGSQNSDKVTLASRFFTMLREQWVITLALTPLTLLLFGQVSLIGLLANTLAIPWVTLVVTPLAMLGLLMPGTWELAALALHMLSLLLTELSKLSFATWSGAQAPFSLALTGIVGGLMLVLHLPWRLRLAGLPLMIPVLLWQPPRPVAGHFELMAPDIGQGNAVLVQTANHSLLYDAGPRFSSDSDAGHRVLVPMLRSLDVQLDLLVISHRDTDHSGGAASVLASQPSAEVLSSIEDSHALQLLRPVKRCLSGQSWIWDGVLFEVIHPAESDYASSTRANALSCVLRISNGAQTVLLTGDIEKQQEQKLAASDVDLKADLLLVPHHGSKTSSSEAFLDAVSPTMAIVQSGYRNRYGHPADIVMQRYASRKISILNSPSCGAFFWESTQATTWRCHRQVAQRYWHHRLP